MILPKRRTNPQGNLSCMNSHVSIAGFAFGRSSKQEVRKHQKSGRMGKMYNIRIISKTGTESPIFLGNLKRNTIKYVYVHVKITTASVLL